MERIEKLTLLSLFINLAYAVYNAAIGFYTHSWWFVTLFLYFSVLSVTRFSLLRIKYKSSGNLSLEIFAEKFTGIMFIIISVSLIGTVILSVIDNHGTKYHEIVMITIALYVFIKMTLAVINLIKARKNDSPVIKTLRGISFADAFVSIFSLQRSMLVSFGEMAEKDIKLFNVLTGSGVCIIIFLLGLNLLEGEKIKMAKSKIVEINEKIADAAVGSYKKIESAVVDGYTKIENSVVGGYSKIEDKFVEKYLTHDGETVEEAKERLKSEDK